MAEAPQPTQKFVEIKEIKNNVVFLKSGGLRQILIVSGVNFDLKSEEEQNLIINSFQNFLNTLDFSVQLSIHSRKVNVNSYLDKMRERKNVETSDLMKIQIEEYVNFIQSFVEQNAIITKNFFVVVPYEKGGGGTENKGIFDFLNTTRSSKKSTTLSESLEQLNHRVSQIISGLEGIGLRAAILTDEELTELFYNLYNPQLTEKKGLEIAKPSK